MSLKTSENGQHLLMRPNSIRLDICRSFVKASIRHTAFLADYVILTLAALLISVFLVTAGCAAPQNDRSTSSNSNTTNKATSSSNNSSNDSTGKNTVFPASIDGLKEPIAMAFAPDNRIFISERGGYVRVVENGKLRAEPFAEINVPKLSGYNETGVLGIAVDPDFKTRPYVYIYRTYSKNGGLFNKVIRVTDVKGSVRDPEIILDDIPGSRIHNGGIILFGPDGNLYIATGEAGNKQLSQDLSSLGGKVLRIKPDGGIPPDNPFKGSPVYSYGHRNIFGMAFKPGTGTLYITENGPSGDDEINRIVAGGNYGWPLASGPSKDRRFVNPVKTYTTTIVPTQAIFYTGSMFDNYRNWFIFGTYNGRDIRALEIAGRNDSAAVKINREKIIYLTNEPIVGVSQSPDGGIYMIGNNSIKKLTKLK
jgi:glucose/arabinose dehydrogenase